MGDGKKENMFALSRTSQNVFSLTRRWRCQRYNIYGGTVKPSMEPSRPTEKTNKDSQKFKGSLCSQRNFLPKKQKEAAA